VHASSVKGATFSQRSPRLCFGSSAPCSARRSSATMRHDDSDSALDPAASLALRRCPFTGCVAGATAAGLRAPLGRARITVCLRVRQGELTTSRHSGKKLGLLARLYSQSLRVKLHSAQL